MYRYHGMLGIMACWVASGMSSSGTSLRDTSATPVQWSAPAQLATYVHQVPVVGCSTFLLSSDVHDVVLVPGSTIDNASYA
jgi:hypothetical protein